MLGTTVPAVLLALGLPSVYAAVRRWDAVYNIDRRANQTHLRSSERNTAKLHAAANVHPGEAGDSYAGHGWTRKGDGPAKYKDRHPTEVAKENNAESSSKWYWGEESNADNANWGMGPGYFGPTSRKAPGDKDVPDSVSPVALHASASKQPSQEEEQEEEEGKEVNTITVQPSTRGQDEGTCGFLNLPERFFMRVKVAEQMALKGDWENDSGAQYLEFVQDLFAWQYESIYFYIGEKLFMKSEVIENEEVQLPSVKLSNARENEKKVYTMALKDCNDVLMYVLRENRTKPYLYEIFNRDDQLVAYSEFGELHSDKMFWYDHLKKPIAIAQSPRLMEDLHRVIDDRADPYFGNVPTWEIKFLKGYDPTAVVSIQQNRWVIAAAIQERAIRSASRGPGGRPNPPEAFPWFVGLTIFALAVCIGAIAYCFYWIFRLVYPKTHKEVENKFLKQDKAIYGELVQGRQNYI